MAGSCYILSFQEYRNKIRSELGERMRKEVHNSISIGDNTRLHHP